MCELLGSMCGIELTSSYQVEGQRIVGVGSTSEWEEGSCEEEGE